MSSFETEPVEEPAASTATEHPDSASFVQTGEEAPAAASEANNPSVSKLGGSDEDEVDEDVARVVAEAIEKEAIAAAAGEEEDAMDFAEGSSNNNEDTLCQPVATTPNAATAPTHRRTNSDSNRKKRLCRYPGCTRVIKSQGHCQRHGAKAKRCKVEGCEKQAQGTHNGMCKRHWRAVHFPDQVAAKAEAERKKELEEQPPPPQGESVYDNVLPASIAYRPSFASHQQRKDDPSDNPATPDAKSTIVAAMPLVNFLRDGALHKPFGWHRQAERRARGIRQCSNLGTQLEPWEKQLALVEIMLLSGGTPHANFKDLAHAWGRERGFHQVLAASVCTRRGEVQRKKRSDAGNKKSKPTTTPLAKRSKTEPPATLPPPVGAPTIYPPPPQQVNYQPMQWQQPPMQQQELKPAPQPNVPPPAPFN